MERNVVERIQQFNQGRDRQLLKLKYEAMRSDIFGFFRGTCHLFYEDWPKDSPLNQAPPAWICGDLHLENFGSYKGDDRQVYFDINDFDEAVLAPCTWDVARLLTSILVASHTLEVDEQEALRLCNNFLEAYTITLAKGQSRSVETETAQGLVKELLESLKARSRKDFLDKRTEVKGEKRRFIIDNKRFRDCEDAKREKVTATVNAWATKQQDPEFFKVLDVAVRIAGTGSLGIPRYAVLIEGKGSPNRNYFLDLKQECPSSLQPYLTLPQPQWINQAQRVLTIQQRIQATPPAMLAEVLLDDKSFLLRELQPAQDKVSLEDTGSRPDRLAKLIETMGRVTAWDQLRSSGRQGSAIADDLIAFATATTHWRDQLLVYAQTYFAQVEADYHTFRKSA
jgi:uncharacterized protein (DUF2252 family)